MAGYYQSGTSLDQAFNFQYYYAITTSLSNQRASDLENLISSLKSSGAALRFFAPFLDNHDQPEGDRRFMDSIGTWDAKNWPQAKLGAAITMTFPGTPYVYYGTEIGMNRGAGSGDQRKRQAMDWSEAYSQLADSSSLVNTYRRMIALRKQHAALRRGDIRLISNGDSTVLAYLRPGPDGSILFVANLGESALYTSLNFSGSGLSSSQTYTVAELNTQGSASDYQGTPSNYSQMYLRGDFNGWGTTGMSLVAPYTWQVTVNGVDVNDEFKFDASGSWTTDMNWGDNQPDGEADPNGNNISVGSTSGTVTFTFKDDETKAYSFSN